MKGNYRKATNDIKTPKSGSNPPFIMSGRQMMWWSALNFCQTLGKTLVEISDYGCAHTICPSGCNAKTGFCHADTSMKVSSGSAYNISANVASMKAAYDQVTSWTNTDSTSCAAYNIAF